MGAIAQYIIDALAWLLEQVYIPFAWVLDALVYILLAFVWGLLDGFLTVITVLVNAINYSSVVFQWAAAYALIPPTAIYVMDAIGFPQMVTLLAAAYAVRLAINLIPSWATRA